MKNSCSLDKGAHNDNLYPHVVSCNTNVLVSTKMCKIQCYCPWYTPNVQSSVSLNVDYRDVVWCKARRTCVHESSITSYIDCASSSAMSSRTILSSITPRAMAFFQTPCRIMACLRMLAMVNFQPSGSRLDCRARGSLL